ncbi:MAG: acyl-ACP--UDP-N-acetylglucosamine O-acyltransferase [Deltaproteobacteria bacterium]|nr:acyl-ACP--UDP-N-acetylglucosamine O-acyltransferase [Deltaproteobacteria bacterium]
MKIHPTTLVHPGAKIGKKVEIGPFCTIGEHVTIGAGTKIKSHVSIDGWTEIGEGCAFYPFSSIGEPPQDLKFKGEASNLKIGKNNVFREFITVNRGTEHGGGETVIGDNNFFMAYCHVAHDCRIGHHVVLANAATLAGHITIDDHAIIGGISAIHQFVRIGRHAIVGGASAVPKDVPPFCNATGNRATLHGLNTIGLKRHEFPEETVRELKKAYRILFRSALLFEEARARVEQEVAKLPEVRELLDFLQHSERGFCR